MINTNNNISNLPNLNSNNSQQNKVNDDKSNFKEILAKNSNQNETIKPQNKVDSSQDVKEVKVEDSAKDEECKTLTKEEIENSIKDINKEDSTDDNKLLLLIASLLEKLKALDNNNSNMVKDDTNKEINLLNNLLGDNSEVKVNEATLMKLNSANGEKLSELKGVLANLLEAVKSGKMENLSKVNPEILNEFKNLLKSVDVKLSPESLKDLNLDDIKNLKNSLNILLNSKNVKSETANLKEEKVETNKNVDIEKVIINTNDGKASSKNAENNTKKESKDEFLKNDKDYSTLKNIIEDPKDKQSNISVFAQRLAEAKNIEQPKEVTVINKNTMVNDIVKTIKYMSVNDTKTLVVKMNPKDLGEVTIKLVAQGESMKATITAANKETTHLLNNAAAEIKKTLENQGIKMSDVNIGLSNEDTTFFSGESNFQRENSTKENRTSNGLNNSDDFEEEIEEESEGTNNINMLV
ncbi:flagellar hook-length control protein FliK [Clostridium cavendishii DSM 21758]|uniref:Flagellar hook-length control protein FliK n=1 Tax=Clostridium cavendishii DSM 21758 TaxID=1121302 RepID=A0A1M6AUR6_9CLOT|nr:flagellar hook-length control protein FliK [Clostridium cavendishii]SHI40289.1 flagellar hook-length control protein FliK [Clostridium cavendishii DSM 21758]